jgi:hypothetical protein
VLTVGKIIPMTGGSGGEGFDGGNTMSAPPPQGIIGMNSMVTYGDVFQCAGPVSHQVTIGQNLQMCIALGALLGEALDVVSTPSTAIVSAAAQAIGGAMGAMQFTVGASAQFTLGQSFEISVGPPKVEIHKSHSKKWDPVRILCVILGTLSELFTLVYDVLKGANNSDSNDPQNAAATPSEQSGDEERAIFILAYQALTDAMLIAILLAEYLTDTVDWLASDLAKKMYFRAPGAFGLWKGTKVTAGKAITTPVGDFDGPPTATNPFWSGAGKITMGIGGIALAVLGEITALPLIGKQADEK